MITNFNIFLNEDVALAKSILNNHKKEIPLGEKDPDYLTIREMLKGKDGYVGLFTKLRYENNINIENLKLLLNDIVRLKDYLGMLPKPITQYDDYEKIYDDLRTIESQKHINYWLKEMPSNLKNEYKNLSADIKQRFSEQILTWQKLEEDVRNSIYRLYFREGQMKGKISLFKTFNDFLSDLTSKVGSATEGFQYANVLKHIHRINAKVEYENFDDQIIVAYIPNVEASKKLGKDTSWCISYQGSNNRWETYNSFNQMTKQYFIWNFNLPFSDNYCMVALTVNKDGEITFMHRKDDYSILSSSDEYFEKWNISEKIFKPLSEKELEIRKKYVEYDKILKDYKAVFELDEKKFNEIISFFGGEFNWNAYDNCICYLISKKLNQQFYNLIKENKLSVEDLIQDGLIKWTLEFDNLELFYYLIDNYQVNTDVDALDDSIGDIYKDIFNLNKEESEVIKVVDYFSSKLPDTIDNYFKDEKSIPDGFFDNIIRHDYLELFKKFYNKIKKDKRNRYMYHPSRGKNTTSFLGYAYKVYEDRIDTEKAKPIKIIEYLINNGAYNDGKLFVYLFDDNKPLYDKLIDNTYFYPDGLENIYTNLSMPFLPLKDTKPKLYTEIIDDLISKNKFDNKYYVESNNLAKDIKVVIVHDLSNEDFLYLINLLIRYIKEENTLDSSVLTSIMKQENSRFLIISSVNKSETYKKVLILSDDKIYSLMKYFPDDSVIKVVEHFIKENNLDGLKKFFSYNFDPKKLNNRVGLILSCGNVEIIKYMLSLKPFVKVDNDELLIIKEKHPELLDLLLKSVDYKIGYFFLLKDTELFKEIINMMPDYTSPKDIWQFKANNLIYAIDNKNLKLQKESLSNALEYDYIPDSPLGVETIKKMCQAGCSIEYIRYDKPLLLISLDKGNFHVFKYLVEECNKNPYKLKKEKTHRSEGDEFVDPLSYAIKSQKIDFIEYVINKFKKPINTKYFVITNVKSENCKKMSDLVLKYVKPDKISDDDKVNLVHSYDDNFEIFCKLFDVYKPDPTKLLKISVNYARNSNEKDIVEFLAGKGADIQRIYDEYKRSKGLSIHTREFFKNYLKNKYKKKKENIETNFDFFKDFISEKNKSKMRYLKEYNDFFLTGSAE